MPKKVSTIASMGILLSVILAGSLLAQAQGQGDQNQPQMNQALQNLRQAEDSLQTASHDKGGHRLRAIELIRQAEQEVQMGIDFDNQHYSRSERGQYPNQYERNGSFQGRLAPDQQRQFDSYYSRWIEARRSNNRDEARSMEERMRDVMSRNNIPPDVPFDQVASSGY
jgi:hypothetical protein